MESTGSIPRELFGTYHLRAGAETYDAVLYALKVGYAGVDTATLYRNETDVGRAILDSRLPRSSLFIQTKVQDKDQGYEETLVACNASLARLHVAFIDSFLIHSPRRGEQRMQDTWRAMIHLQAIGLVRNIGVSNFNQHHIEHLGLHFPQVTPAINQVDRSPFNTRKELKTFCEERGICFQAYAPLTRGKCLSHPTLRQVAQEHNATTAQVLLKWAEMTCDSFVVKSKSLERIRENADVGSRPRLTTEHMQRLNQLHDPLFAVMGWNLCDIGEVTQGSAKVFKA